MEKWKGGGAEGWRGGEVERGELQGPAEAR